MNRVSADTPRFTRGERRAAGRLLVGCVTAWPNELTATMSAQRASDLVRETPFGLLVDAARVHRVSSLVHDVVATVDDTPQQLIEALAADRRQAAAHHLRTVRAAKQIGAALDAVGVPWLIMKGPVLTGELYLDAGSRTYGDLDLLVTPDRFPDAVRALEAAGFSHRVRNWPLAEWYRAGQISLSRADVELDLHWDLLYAHYDRRRFTISADPMIERRRVVSISGWEAPTFDAVDTVLTLGLHATRSGAHRLIWLKDLQRAFEVLEPDEDELERRCRETGCADALGLALARCELVLGVELGTGGLVRRLSSPSLRWLDRAASSLQDVVQLDDRDTMPRFVARSTRSSPRSSVADLLRRSARAVRRRVGIKVGNESGDADERARFLEGVSAGGGNGAA